VLPAVARALGVPAVEHEPLVERLKAYLYGKQLLLVLDNFEHVAAAAPLIGDLLESAPQLKVLVTSRVCLHLYGEHEYITSPLQVPDLARLPAAGELLRYTAIELFVQRARAARLDFYLNDQNARSVAELCAHLDGLPLAIELAAAHSKQLPPAALLAKLVGGQGAGGQGAGGQGAGGQGAGGAPWEVLTNKARNVPPRQQALYSAIEWSYGLLTPVEQRVFRSLGVFAGGCDLPALAAANGVAPGVHPQWLLDAANRLVDKSMVVTQGSGVQRRFTLLEMMREYALQQLAANGELEQMRAAHAAYYLALGDALDRQMHTPQEMMRMTAFRAEPNNLRAALAWGLEHDPARCLALAAQLAQFANMLDLHFEAREWLERVLGRVQRQNTRPYAHAARRVAAVLWMQEDLHAAEAWITASIQCWRQIADEHELGIVLLFWALILLHRDEYEAALLPAQEGVALLRQGPRTHWLPIGLHVLGRIYCALGEYAAAEAAVYEGLALPSAQEDRWGAAQGTLCKADVAYAQRDYAGARFLYAEALQVLRAIASGTWPATRAALSLGKVLWQLGEPQPAVAYWQESIATGRTSGARKYMAGALLMLGLAAQRAGDGEQAAALCRESLGIYRQTQNDVGFAYALAGLAGVRAGRCAGGANDGADSCLATAASALGAAARLKATRRMLQDDVELQHYERIVAVVRASLDPEVFATAWVQGQTMAPEQAVASLLANVEVG
jgi:predicted ATPase